MSPDEYRASPAFGSGAISDLIRDLEDGQRRFWLRHVLPMWARNCRRHGMCPAGALRVLRPDVGEDWHKTVESDLVLSQRERWRDSQAMRAGRLLEAELFWPEVRDWYDRSAEGSTKTERERARQEASILRRCQGFDVLQGVLESIRGGRCSVQPAASAELRPGVFCKALPDLVWQTDAGWVECDFKRWTHPKWTTPQELERVAVKVGAHWQRALYRKVLAAHHGGAWHSLILAVDPTRSPEPVEHLLQLEPETERRAEAEVDRALDFLAMQEN
jgi:hypothetical protein